MTVCWSKTTTLQQNNNRFIKCLCSQVRIVLSAVDVSLYLKTELALDVDCSDSATASELVAVEPFSRKKYVIPFFNTRR